MVELVDSVDLGSTARACRFESCCPHQKSPDPFGVGRFFARQQTRTHLNASVRWTLAATSSKTGCYNNFSFPLRERKMQIGACCPLSSKKKAPLLGCFHFLLILYVPSGGANAGTNHAYLSMDADAFHVIYPPVQPESRSALICADTSLGP